MKKVLLSCVFLTVCSLTLIACSERDPSVRSQGLPLQTRVSIQDSLHFSNPSLVEVEGVQLNFIDLPAVTAEEVQELQQTLSRLRDGSERTSIVAMPAFRAAEAKTSIGLYHAVMGVYPALALVDRLNDRQRAEILRQWEENPDLPLTFTTEAEDIRFAQELSRITGRRFSIMTNSQNEYSIRGRALDENGHPTGPITTSIYHFGEGEHEVQNHAFIRTNPLTLDRAHGVHEIPEGAEALYKNTFGIIHPIGNVWSRSIDGIVRGGAFGTNARFSKSSSWLEDNENGRDGDVGSRLAESLSD